MKKITTIKIDEDVLHRLRVYCVNNKTKIYKVIEEAINEKIK